MYRLLIVEDERSTRRWLAGKIPWSEFGFELAAVAEDGKEAWEWLRNDPSIDVVMTDIRMPHMDGMELLHRIRTEGLSVHAVISSGYGDFEYARQAIKLGVSSYLLKPITKEALQMEFDRLRSDLDEKYLQQQEREQANRMKKELENREKTERLQRILLHGEPLAGADGKLSEAFVSFSRQPFITLIAEIDRYEKFKLSYLCEDRKLCRFAVMNVLSEIAARFACLEAVELTENRYLFYIPVGSRSPEELTYDIGRRFQEALRKYVKAFEITLSVGGSGAAQCPERLPAMYAQAEKALQHKFFKGTSAVVAYSETVSRVEECCYPVELEKDLLHRLKRNETEEVHRLLAQFFETFEHRGTPEGVRTIAGELLVHITRNLIELKSMDVKSGLMQHVLRQIQGTETLRELIATMKELIEFILQVIRMEGAPLSPVDKGIEYLKRNLGREISLQEVADYSGKSASYFSTQFKQEKGQNFIDFLVGLRLEKARELLETTNMTIAQIAEHVGYYSYRYFSKVFKERLGVTPTQYREQIKASVKI